MKTVIVYYTFGGSSKKEAERIAAELNVPSYRVKEARKRSFLAAFIPGGLEAGQRRTVAIQPLEIDLKEFDRIIIVCPVWNAHPAPAFNAIVERLPREKEVEIILCSGGGGTAKSKQGTKEMIEEKGCTLISYRDVLTGVKPGKLKE